MYARDILQSLYDFGISAGTFFNFFGLHSKRNNEEKPSLVFYGINLLSENEEKRFSSSVIYV